MHGDIIDIICGLPEIKSPEQLHYSLQIEPVTHSAPLLNSVPRYTLPSSLQLFPHYNIVHFHCKPGVTNSNVYGSQPDNINDQSRFDDNQRVPACLERGHSVPVDDVNFRMLFLNGVLCRFLAVEISLYPMS